MRQSINSKRKSEGNDGTENISDQTFKKLNATYDVEAVGRLEDTNLTHIIIGDVVRLLPFQQRS